MLCFVENELTSFSCGLKLAPGTHVYDTPQDAKNENPIMQTNIIPSQIDTNICPHLTVKSKTTCRGFSPSAGEKRVSKAAEGVTK